MSVITKPIILDETGVAIKDAILSIADALAPTKSGTIYGFHIDGNESDPSAAVTYVADAVGMTPAGMNYSAGTFNYGSWRNAFFMPRPCMLKFDGTVDYYLDPNDYGKRYGSDTASDVTSDSYGGNAMMEWGQNGKKIWYKIVADADPASCTVYIADYQADGDFRAWSFINSQGQMVDHFYTPIYNGYSDSSNRLRSLSGKTPTTGLNASTERTRARANNSSLAIWDTEVFADIILITLLLTLMGKSLNSQAVFGQGCTTPDKTGVLVTGTGDTLGLFYGYTDTTKVVKVFGMENFWSNLWRRFAGMINNAGTYKYKLTRGSQDGSTASDYSDLPAGYLDGGAILGSGKQRSQRFGRYAFFPDNIRNATEATYYCDHFFVRNDQVSYACRGGAANLDASCGVWCLDLNDLANTGAWYINSSPSCKPLA